MSGKHDHQRRPTEIPKISVFGSLRGTFCEELKLTTSFNPKARNFLNPNNSMVLAAIGYFVCRSPYKNTVYTGCDFFSFR